MTDLKRYRVTLILDVDREQNTAPDNWNWRDLIDVDVHENATVESVELLETLTDA